MDSDYVPRHLDTDAVESRPERRWLWVALAVTAIAIPLVVLDNLPEDDDTQPLSGVEIVEPSAVPDDRPESGPVKGVSVVTSSTTSSTVPITTSTTTTTVP